MRGGDVRLDREYPHRFWGNAVTGKGQRGNTWPSSKKQCEWKHLITFYDVKGAGIGNVINKMM